MLVDEPRMMRDSESSEPRAAREKFDVMSTNLLGHFSRDSFFTLWPKKLVQRAELAQNPSLHAS